MIPTFNTKAVWELSVSVRQKSPTTGVVAPVDLSGSRLWIEFVTLGQQAVGAASTDDGRIVLTDAVGGKFAITIPVEGRPPTFRAGQIMGDVFRSVGGGEPRWLGRITAMLTLGT